MIFELTKPNGLEFMILRNVSVSQLCQRKIEPCDIYEANHCFQQFLERVDSKQIREVN